MGFIKRLLSIGSKKGKKANTDAQDGGRKPVKQLLSIPEMDTDHEEAANQLLRSSSARFFVPPKRTSAPLPPLPPIDRVISPPASSAASTVSSTTNSYTVTVHKRERFVTAFPAPSESPDKSYVTAKDSSQIIRLRQDPSVASLLNMYDDHGRLPSQAFSASPQKERAQTKRSGSTLRQLLGNPGDAVGKNTDFSTLEGDISWAERFLGETDTSSSSIGPDTPTDLEHSADCYDQSGLHHPNNLSVYDGSADISGFSNLPAISSMEVELSVGQHSLADESTYPEPSIVLKNSPYIHTDPTTPQRASQVFDFIKDKRQNKMSSISAYGYSGSTNVSRYTMMLNDADDSEVEDENRIPASDDPAQILSLFEFNDSQTSHRQKSSQPSQRSALSLLSPGEAKNPVQLIVTAPTPKAAEVLGRNPRGPRQPSSTPTKLPSNKAMGPRTMLGERSNAHPVASSSKSHSINYLSPHDPFTLIPTRRLSQQDKRSIQRIRSSSSASSMESTCSEADRGFDDGSLSGRGKNPGRRIPRLSNAPYYNRSSEESLGKEHRGSAVGATFKSRIPVTPNRRPHAHLVHDAPSPASSSELSPFGQQMMLDLRMDKENARGEVEKGTFGRRGGISILAGGSYRGRF